MSFAWHDTSTDRTVNVAGTDQLRADFNARSFGARFEGGRRFAAPLTGWLQWGITPFAAVQVQSLRTPSYGETAASGSNQFALAFASQTTTDTRSELGVQFDTRFALANGAQLVWRSRYAWVHDFNPENRFQAAFQTLPGTSLIVDGAAAARNAALLTSIAELRLAGGVSLVGRFDSELARRANTYAGTATLRYAW